MTQRRDKMKSQAIKDLIDTRSTPLIVTRHVGAVDWLQRQGIEGDIIPHATAEAVAGRHVIGNLPLHLASYAESITTITMPSLPPEWRGKNLTAEQMEEAGATLQRFVVLDATHQGQEKDPVIEQKIVEEIEEVLVAHGWGCRYMRVNISTLGYDTPHFLALDQYIGC